MPERPNVLVIFSDQQRWDTLGCYGQSLPVSPHLDRMAGEGVRFEHAFTCQPVCGPARSCLQTGKYATETGCYRNHIALPTDERTIAHLFNEAGYETGYIGKWHLASTAGESELDLGPPADFRTKPVPPERRGGYADHWIVSDVLEFTSHSYDGHLFDAAGRQVPIRGYRADSMTDLVLDYLRSRDGTRPFFLFVSYIEPHHQNDHNRYEGPVGSQERFADYQVPGDLAGTEGDWRENFPDYLGCCAALDDAAGRIRAELVNQGIADDTLVVYTSDHGSHFRTRNSEYKRSCHEGCIRIPLLISGPGFPAGHVVDAPASLIDVPPTLLAAAGIRVPEYMRGRPLQQAAQPGGAPADWPEDVFLQISESQVGRAVRTRRWKYSVYAPEKRGAYHAGSDQYEEQFLYDLAADPYERHNLVDSPDHAEIRSQLAQRLRRRMHEAGEPEPAIRPHRSG